MLDSLMAAYGKLKQKPLDPNYRPEDAILGRRLLNQKSERLVVIFPGWKFRGFLYEHLINRLRREGWAVLAYDFHNQILEADEKTVLKSFDYIQKTVAWELRLLSRKHHYKQIHFVGISLGNVAMTMIADAFHDFTGATIVAGGDDLAVDMWHGLRTQYLRDEFREDHVNLIGLDAFWQDLDPANHVRPFTDKPIFFLMPLHDKFILTKYQKRLARALDNVGSRLTVKQSRCDHVFSIIRFCFTGTLLV